MVAVPLATPVTTPLSLPTLALPLLELHTPPPAASLKLVVLPTQTVPAPVIVPALNVVEFTVTVALATQPGLPHSSKVIVAVPPETPITIPDEPTVAILVLLLDHTLSDPASLKVVVAPWHTTVDPVIEVTAGKTFTSTSEKQPYSVV